MPERHPLILKTLCGLLAVLVAYQLSRLFRVHDPLEGVTLPDVASLSVEPVAPPVDEGSSPGSSEGEGPGFSGGRPGGGRRGPQLPPDIQNQVNAIRQSEILGRLPRPQPLMLLGIAGRHAFLQTPTGQAGLAAEGEEVGGVKVLRIGTNRVLVEVEGDSQELVLFPNLSGESLLPNLQPSRP